MTRFAVVDFETTDREPEKAHIVEWAVVVIDPHWFGSGGPEPVIGGLVKPPVPIPPEVSAVHHIVDADVANAQTWEEERTTLLDILSRDGTIGVAHNANYERAMLASLNLTCPWLCTYKAALRIWPDAPGHSNETLRYWLGFGTGRSGQQKPHSAAHDAEVTAQLLSHLIAAGANVDEMIRWSDEPALLPRCPLGDWRGHPWSDVETSFLQWILRKIHDREDVRFCANTELDRRAEEARKTRSAEEEGSDLPF